MSRKAWCTKEDVMKDLARATGTLAELDERYFIYGEMPPPPLQDASGEVLMDDGFLSNMNDERPDLSGIKNCLRMLKAEQEETTPIKTNGVIVISKLNPNVKEFVPSNQLNSRTTENKQPDKTNLVKKESSSKINETAPQPDKTNLVKKESISKINETPPQKDDTQLSEHSNDRKDKEEQIIINQIKEKISNAAQSETHKSKRDKNVALSHLMKLHTSKEPIKLLTPSFFEQPKPAEEQIIDKIAEKIEEEAIKESVSKVDEWLNMGASAVSVSATPSPRPKKNVLLDSKMISYKKRETNSPIPKKEKKSDSPVDKKFVPTPYAGELRKKYEEKSSKREEEKRASLNIWEKLHLELKSRDDERWYDDRKTLEETPNLDK